MVRVATTDGSWIEVRVEGCDVYVDWKHTSDAEARGTRYIMADEQSAVDLAAIVLTNISQDYTEVAS